MLRRVAALTALLLGGCSDGPTQPSFPDPAAEGGRWATWTIASGSALRPPPPPSDASVEAQRELDEIAALQQARTPESTAMMQRWAVLPTSPWTNLTIDLLERYWILLPDVRTATPAQSARAMALLHVAMYDALVATWDAKYEYRRRAPHQADGRIRALVAAEDVPSYPSEHAAAAAAAAAVLSYLFPVEDAAGFSAMAAEAGEARILSGVAHRSDVEAGYAIGRAAAERAIAIAREDGSSRPWSGAIPEGPGMWAPTRPRFVEKPFDPTAGSWRTWVIPDGSSFRPPPPPALGSAEFDRDLQELRTSPTTLTLAQADAARYWATDAPSAWWELFAEEEIVKRKMPALHAARAHALISVAMYDAFVACWDAKYHYALARPVTVDPEVQTVFSTPPFPSYPSGHSTQSAAAAEVFAHLFPDREEHYRERAHQASLSRVWGGVHYRFDILAGEELGEKVGRAVVERARQDGSVR